MFKERFEVLMPLLLKVQSLRKWHCVAGLVVCTSLRACSAFEMLVTCQPVTQCHIPDDVNPYRNYSG